ncbi:MAG: hypothetical protein WBM34_06840 [Woeseiaceae bacterium]
MPLLSGKDLETVYEFMIADRHGAACHRDREVCQCSFGGIVPEHGLAVVGQWRVL